MSNAGDLGEYRIALVHDELTRRGGAERVYEEMVRLLPNADLYALYAGQPRVTINNRHYSIRTTFLQRLPKWFRRYPRRVLPLLPYAAEQIDLSDYDLVISSSSGFAKGVVTRAAVPHVCYCHTPTRYVWDARHLALSRAGVLAKLPGMAVLHWLRLTDYAAAQRVDVWLANSQWTRERIATYYRRPSQVIYPPIETSFFTPSLAPRSYFLCVGRLTPAKHFEQAISVCEKLRLPLVVVGEGSEMARLGRLAGRYTKFTGRIDRERLRRYYREARALLQPAEEDFGMAAAEALACGIPVIAYERGGASEIVRSRETGILYQQRTVEALAEAIREFLLLEETLRPELCQQSVMKFSTYRFEREFLGAVRDVLAGRPMKR